MGMVSSGARMTLPRLSETAGPLGEMVADMFTTPAKPARLVSVMFDLNGAPDCTTMGSVGARMLKGTVLIIIRTESETEPLTPVMVAL